MKSSILVLIITLLTGCEITGTASKTTFPILTNAPTFQSGLNSVNLITDESTADNESYGAFNWGSFDESDKKVIQQTILNTINKNAAGIAKQANVHVKIHRYSQVITNASYASFVIVDWCLELKGEIISDEVFYAGLSDELNIFTGKTLGWAKGETHKAITSRIINKSIETLTVPVRKSSYPEANIYLNAAEAVEALPKQLTSIGTAGFSGGGYYYVGSQTGNTDFDKKAIYKKVDWATKIQ
ncbi:MAG: hypothetical protein HRT53_13140 [Colwellia sp.]|nr:hypothetical protein [Colwellia sp.]